MRKWGWVVTGFYALVLAGLLLAVVWSLRESDQEVLWEVYRSWFTWFWLGVLVGGEAILLLVTVDTSFQLPGARQSVWLSVGVVGGAMALLTFFAVWSAVLAVAEKNSDIVADSVLLAAIPVFWTFWAGVFYWHSRERADLLTRGISWLLKGSVLELLVVVPCHVYVRRRGDCSAPAITGFGIATGIAVMLLSFGPSVLFLYKRRLERYSTAASPPAQR